MLVINSVVARSRRLQLASIEQRKFHKELIMSEGASTIVHHPFGVLSDYNRFASSASLCAKHPCAAGLHQHTRKPRSTRKVFVVSAFLEAVSYKSSRWGERPRQPQKSGWLNPKRIPACSPRLRRRRAEAALWRAAKAEGTSYLGCPNPMDHNPNGVASACISHRTKPRWGLIWSA